MRVNSTWEFLHPRCAVERADDLEEVDAMLAADETEIAKEELLWLVGGCSDFMRAHRSLGELAMAEEDFALARGHFGHAYRVGVRAIQSAGNPQPIPYTCASNCDFFECGKGLVHSLMQLGKKKMAAEVAAQLVRCDPSDPLGVARMIDSRATGD